MLQLIILAGLDIVNLPLFQLAHRSNKLLNLFSFRHINLWNSLYPSVTKASSIFSISSAKIGLSLIYLSINREMFFDQFTNNFLEYNIVPCRSSA